MGKICYILPDFLCFGRNELLIYFYKNYLNIFFEKVNIASFYGTFPNAIFNGGRPCFANCCTKINEIKKVKKFYNKKDIKITLTFTNQCLEEKHLTDKYCNQILKVFHDGYNEVLVSSPLLENYIREKYPKYKINKSITATIKDNDENYMDYNLVVIDKKNNKNFEYLKLIKDKNKIEILCDEVCINDCKYTKQHYEEISLEQLGKVQKSKNFAKCRFDLRNYKYNFLYSRNMNSKYYISKTEISNIYLPLGFRYFKISGRGKYNFVGYESIFNYLLKENYIYDVLIFVYERTILELEDDIKNGKYK